MRDPTPTGLIFPILLAPMSKACVFGAIKEMIVRTNKIRKNNRLIFFITRCWMVLFQNLILIPLIWYFHSNISKIFLFKNSGGIRQIHCIIFFFQSAD
jgi:hypothetical protein